MKIKEIFIRGFKSFLGPMRVDLSSRIIAFVGPNGCGKSNIVDAIRWCLGEQNPRVLRAIKMEDVIFNGAGEVKPLGVAEVKLLLEDCTDETIPEHLRRPEIEITRRLYRTGESEYLINNIPSRLKDIWDLFLGTGLSQRCYSIIGQGSIGAIIDYRPDQLRDLLHEAVDITRYQKQIEQAKRRVSEAQENLLRVKDLLSELERQLSTLKRQAEKAKKYKRLVEELQNLELTLLSNEYNLLNRSLSELNKFCTSLVTEEASLRAGISAEEAKLQHFEASYEQLDQKIKSLHKDYGKSKSQLENKQTLIRTKEKEILFFKKRRDELLMEIDSGKAKLSSLTQEIQNLEQEKVQLFAKVEEIKEQRDIYNKKIEEDEKRLEDLKKEYLVTKDQFYNIEKQRDSLQKEIEFLTRTKFEIDKRKQEFQKEKALLQTEIDSLKQRWQERALQRKVYEERLNEIDTAVVFTEQDIQKAMGELAALQQQAKSLERDLTEKRLRLKTLQELITGHAHIRPGTRHILKMTESSHKKTDAIKGLLAELIEVEPGIEKAVEAVLGEKLEYVVVGTIKDSIELLDHLKKEAKGKSGFIISSNGNGKAIKTAKLAELIKAPDEIKTVLHELLKDVELVESFNRIALQPALDNGKIYVTLDGDVIYHNLIVYGGGEEKTAQGIITKKLHLKQLSQEYQEIESKFNSLLSVIETKKNELQNLKEKHANLQQTKSSISEKLRKVDYELYKIGTDIEGKQKLLDLTEKNISKKYLEENISNDQMNELRHKLDTISKVDTEKKRLLEELSEIIKQKEKARDALKKEFYKIDASLKVIEEKGSSLEKAIAKGLRDLREKKENISRLKGQLEQNERNIRDGQIEINNMSEEIDYLQQQVNEYRHQINKKEEEMHCLKEEMGNVKSKIVSLSQRLEKIREDLTKAKMSETEIRTEIKNILNTAMERHNLDISTLYKNYVLENYSKYDLELQIQDKRAQKTKMGEVNLLAISEYEETKKRYDFLKEQEEDLIKSIENINHAILRFRSLAKEGLFEGLKEINHNLNTIFCSLFGGGNARVRLLEEDDALESGMVLEAELPGKRLTHLGLLSGGEKSLVAAALLFAIFRCRPSPFCLLDEVDSALDDINVERLCKYLLELKEQTQIIMVTHKPKTMSIADLLYGVTMETKGISKIISANISNLGLRKQ